MGHSHAVSQKQTHDNPELIAAAMQFSRICLVVSEPIVVPSAANERLALVQKDFAAYEYRETGIINVFRPTQVDHQ